MLFSLDWCLKDVRVAAVLLKHIIKLIQKMEKKKSTNKSPLHVEKQKW